MGERTDGPGAGSRTAAPGRAGDDRGDSLVAAPGRSPVLDAGQLEVLRRCGTERDVAAGEVLFADGDETYDLIVMLDGTAEIIQGYGRLGATFIAGYRRSQFLGEIGMLTGQWLRFIGKGQQPSAGQDSCPVQVISATDALVLAGLRRDDLNGWSGDCSGHLFGFGNNSSCWAPSTLILLAMVGDQSLFTRSDGIERLWEISTPLLENPPPVEPYPVGSFGPESVRQLIAPYHWHLPHA